MSVPVAHRSVGAGENLRMKPASVPESIVLPPLQSRTSICAIRSEFACASHVIFHECAKLCLTMKADPRPSGSGRQGWLIHQFHPEQSHGERNSARTWARVKDGKTTNQSSIALAPPRAQVARSLDEGREPRFQAASAVSTLARRIKNYHTKPSGSRTLLRTPIRSGQEGPRTTSALFDNRQSTIDNRPYDSEKRSPLYPRP